MSLTFTKARFWTEKLSGIPVRVINVQQLHGVAEGYVTWETQNNTIQSVADDLCGSFYNAAELISRRYRVRRFAYLHHLKVDEHARSNGIGMHLVETFIKAAKKYDAEIVSLYANPETDLDRNFDRLIKFYERSGFKQCDKNDKSIGAAMELLLIPMKPLPVIQGHNATRVEQPKISTEEWHAAIRKAHPRK